MHIMKWRGGNELREMFLKYFEEKGLPALPKLSPASRRSHHSFYHSRYGSLQTLFSGYPEPRGFPGHHIPEMYPHQRYR